MAGSRAEAELVSKALAGDAEAFAALCERHRGRVWRTVSSVAGGSDAEDLAQEAVVRAWCALQSYRAEAPFEAWLCRIAVNVAHDYHRSAWRRRVLLCDTGQPETDALGPCPVGESERRDLQRRVRQAVSRLPEGQRAPIWLHYFEGFSLAEVARLEGTSESTVRSRVRAGLRRLSFSLEDLLASPAEAARLEPDRRGCGA